MALRQTQITTGAAAMKLVGPDTRRRALLISNHDATNAVVLGGSTVTATGIGTGGAQLKAATTFPIIEGLMAQEEWWAVAAAGTPIVGVVETLL
jgi:hypothetical protein